MEFAEAKAIAMTTKRQIGVMGLGVVGARNFGYGGAASKRPDALFFDARLHFKGQTRVRIMQVTVMLNDLDLYDVFVFTPEGVRTFATNVYGDQLTATMYRLDSEGVER